MRLFVAVRVPERICGQVAGALASVPGGAGVRWTGRATWHLTLAFYGEVPERRLGGVTGRLARVAGRYPAMPVSLSAAGTFPRDPRRATVLWLGVAGGGARLGRLAASATAAARHSGIAVGEGRRYHPHLTIGRCRRPADLTAEVEALSAFRSDTWQVDRIELIRSHLGPSPQYETLHAWPLAPPAPESEDAR